MVSNIVIHVFSNNTIKSNDKNKLDPQVIMKSLYSLYTILKQNEDKQAGVNNKIDEENWKINQKIYLW